MAEAVETIQTNSDFEPYKQKAFEAFLLWLSLPVSLKQLSANAVASEFVATMGFDDEQVVDLIGVRTQKQFAERFGVNEDTLTAWKRKEQARQALEDLRQWAAPLSKNVLLSLYTKIINGNGQPQHFKLWFQIVNGWSEKLTLLTAKRQIRTVKVEIVDTKTAKPEPPFVVLKKRM